MMKRSIVILLLLSLTVSAPVSAQGILKKVTGAMKDELLGTGSRTTPNQDPEPGCACNDAELVVDLGGKLKLNYKELSISTMDDGSILMQDRQSGNYYIVKGGVTTGPIQPGDPRIAGFESFNPDTEDIDELLQRYKGILSKSGEKYNITMGGKSYGPYAEIHDLTVTRSRDKFAALVVENVAATEDRGKAMDEAIKKAKTDQERMELIMKFSQEISGNIMQGGGPESMMPKLVTNIPDATYDPVNTMGAGMCGGIKYDDILIVAYDKIIDLKGKTLFNIDPEMSNCGNLFVNTNNTKYAYDNFGTLTFSDKTTLPDMFNPYLTKAGGQVYLAYMYYSPKRNAIMQCKIAF